MFRLIFILLILTAPFADAVDERLAPFITSPKKCLRIMRDLNVQDLLIRSAEGKAQLDIVLKDIVRQLRAPSISPAERNRLHRELSELLFPLLTRTAIAHFGAEKLSEDALLMLFKTL